MGKIVHRLKHWFINLNLKNSYIAYMAITLVLASVIGAVFMFAINELKYWIEKNEIEILEANIIMPYEEIIIEGINYKDDLYKVVNTLTNESYILKEDSSKNIFITAHHDREGRTAILYLNKERMQNSTLITFILGNLILIMLPLMYLLGCIFSSFVYFNKKLKKPISILNTASDKIAYNDLDFQIIYENNDEMGRLCSSFEKMRSALYDNNKKLWHAMEQRKRLNSAFSHDLRTPLTVLKGYSEMLLEENENNLLTKEDLTETLKTMSKNITRLENYTYEMSRMQKLEEISINKRQFKYSKLVNDLEDSGTIIAKKLKFILSNKSDVSEINADYDIILQVYENLVTNATRYAKTLIKVECDVIDNYLVIVVMDDGQGFSKEALRLATNPFYKERENVDNMHFGLGLYICKVLTNNHGGSIIVENNEVQGAKITAIFSIK